MLEDEPASAMRELANRNTLSLNVPSGDEEVRTHMHLWNDYEGGTIGGAFLLGTLLRTEGRSASFTTKDRQGRPAIIRLTEALNDEETIRARYRAIQAAAHPNLVTIEDFGDADFEGTPLTYVVTEKTEESLAEILAVRRLTVEETGEVALSVAGGLHSLHEHGLVHGLLEPASVLAVGEVIKLRTDCVRLVPGTEGAQARARDVFGLADVLHRSLTQQHLQEASDALALPEPYASIVRNVLRGNWGLDAVTAELRRHLRPVAAPIGATLPSPAAAFSPEVLPMAPHGNAREGSKAKALSAKRSGDGTSQLEDTPSFAETLAAANRVVDRAAAATGTHGESPERNGSAATGLYPGQSTMPDAEPRLPFIEEGERGVETPRSGSTRGLAAMAEEPASDGPGSSWIVQRRGWVLGSAALLVGLILLLLHFVGNGSRQHAAGTALAPAAPATVSRPIRSMTAPMGQPAASPPAASLSAAPAARRPSAGTAAPEPVAKVAAVPPGGKVWRVVAYTYNREDQAAAKARLIAEHHPNLRPTVFSRTGHAPYLVTLGGPMPEAQATAMRQRARGEGLARDVYMQNYSR